MKWNIFSSAVTKARAYGKIRPSDNQSFVLELEATVRASPLRREEVRVEKREGNTGSGGNEVALDFARVRLNQ